MSLWHLQDRWWEASEIPGARKGKSDRTYYRVETPGRQFFEPYTDAAAGGVWVVDVVHD